MSVGANITAKMVRFTAHCGPIAIPVDRNVEQTRTIFNALVSILDEIDPQPDEEEGELDTDLVQSMQTIAANNYDEAPADDRFTAPQPPSRIILP